MTLHQHTLLYQCSNVGQWKHNHGPSPFLLARLVTCDFFLFRKINYNMREFFKNFPEIQEHAALLMQCVNMSIRSKYVTLTYCQWVTSRFGVFSFPWSTAIPFIPHSTAHIEWHGCTLWTKVSDTIWTGRQWKWRNLRIQQVSPRTWRIASSSECCRE